MALPDYIQITQGTAIVWGESGASGVTAVLSLNNLASGSARQGAAVDVLLNLLLQLAEIAVPSQRVRRDQPSQTADRVGNVADDLMLREIDLVKNRAEIVEMNDTHSVPAHEEGRLFHHIMADVDDHIRPADSAVQIVMIRESGGAEAARMEFIRCALAHLG